MTPSAAKLINHESVNRLIVILLLALLPLSVFADRSHLAVGPNIGAAMWMGDGSGNKPGLNAGLSFDYTYYWDFRNDISFGIGTGLKLDYRMSTLSSSIHDEYTNTDYLGHPMDYDITGTARQSLRQLAVSVPVLVGIQKNGFTLNLGVRAVLPSLYSRSVQTVRDLDIAATYREYGVTVVNALATGRATEDQRNQSFSVPISRFQLLGAVEIGYEWSLAKPDHYSNHNSRRYSNRYSSRSFNRKSNRSSRRYSSRSSYRPSYRPTHRNSHRYFRDVQSFGIVLYADYALCNVNGFNASSSRVVDVEPISNPRYPVPAVTIGSAFQPDARYRYFDVGIRFYYSFSIVHGRRYGWRY